jgi:hypothetical protein
MLRPRAHVGNTLIQVNRLILRWTAGDWDYYFYFRLTAKSALEVVQLPRFPFATRLESPAQMFTKIMRRHDNGQQKNVIVRM